MAIGQLVQDLRQSKGWTQKDLAKKAKMRNELVSRIERGSNARIEQYEKIAIALGFRGGAFEMFTSGGDESTAKLLRLWRRLQDPEARKDVLQTMRAQIVADAERDAT